MPPPVTKLETTAKQRVEKTNQNEEGGKKGTLKGRMDNEREMEGGSPLVPLPLRWPDATIATTSGKIISKRRENDARASDHWGANKSVTLEFRSFGGEKLFG